MPANAGLGFGHERPAALRIRSCITDIFVIHIKPQPGAGRRAAGEAHGPSLVIFNGINAKARRTARRWRGFWHLQ
jgi:hypothetical protein